MDERVKQMRTINGQVEFRIKRADADDLGPRGIGAEILSRGFWASDLGQPFWRRNTMHIPIRRDES